MARQSEDARSKLRDAYRNVSDRYDDRVLLDYDSWWRNPEILPILGPLLAEPFIAASPTVVVGPAASGYLLGPLTALALNVGFVAVSKHPRSSVDSDAWRIRTTPPDYQDRHLELGFRRRLVTSTDRVVAVDDLVDTGSQLLVIQALVEDAGATWLGASVLIDNCAAPRHHHDPCTSQRSPHHRRTRPARVCQPRLKTVGGGDPQALRNEPVLKTHRWCNEADEEPVRHHQGVATLFLVVGLSGSGKTTTAKRLAVEQHALRLTTDAWAIALLGDAGEADGRRWVLEGRLIWTALEAVTIGTNVILDFGFWGRDERSSLRWLATERGAAHVLVYLPVNRETQLQRLGQRGRDAPQETFDISEAEVDAGRRQFQEPDQDELGGGPIPPPPTDWSSWSDWVAARWPSSVT